MAFQIDANVRPNMPNRRWGEVLLERVSFEGRLGVDVLMQPPLHSHVPVFHAMPDFDAKVGVVAVDVLDGSEVIGS